MEELLASVISNSGASFAAYEQKRGKAAGCALFNVKMSIQDIWGALSELSYAGSITTARGVVTGHRIRLPREVSTDDK